MHQTIDIHVGKLRGPMAVPGWNRLIIEEDAGEEGGARATGAETPTGGGLLGRWLRRLRELLSLRRRGEPRPSEPQKTAASAAVLRFLSDDPDQDIKVPATIERGVTILRGSLIEASAEVFACELVVDGRGLSGRLLLYPPGQPDGPEDTEAYVQEEEGGGG